MSGVGPRTANTFNQPAPSNYVAGVGRGAMGFTTRSDIGPARPMSEPPGPGGTAGSSSGGGFADPQFGVAPAGYVAGMGRGMGELARGQTEGGSRPPADGDRGDYSESNYDEFSGYGERLFSANTPYDEDDAEADKIYDKVDNAMDSRRKRSREQQLLLQQKSARNGRPRIADQFADLKRELSTVSSAEWDAIPEVGDHSLKLKQTRKKETFTPAPDFLIESYSSRNALNQQETSTGGGTPATGFASVAGGLAEARGIALSSKLDGMSDDVSGQTVVDPKGYLTSLESVKINSTAEVGDIKRARHLLHSVTTTNPKHGPGWIAAARVEEFASNMVQARKIITEGCLSCPDSEDVWLEAARLHNPDLAKKILANGARSIPKSVKIWLAAAELEGSNLLRKKAVLRKALEFIPGSVKLWKAAIGLENVNDARIMLARAVECVPESVEMWLALAKLETHENARKVLNEAREKNPTERLTWITAAKLEEAHGNNHLVGRIIEKMVVSLEQYDVAIGRDVWIQEAEDCEHSGSPLTCEAIVKCTIHLGVEEEDLRTTWMDDAETCLAKVPPSKETARAIYNHALEKFPTKKTLWQCAAMLEKEHGTAESLNAKLLEGVKHCPQGEVLWLMAAKERWLAGNVPAARDILLEAFNANPKSEQIWLAAIKLEWENGEFTRAQLLLSKAREHAPTERIYLKSALLEYELADYAATIRLLDEAIGKYPSYAKYYLMQGQCIDTQLKDPVKARQVYLNGLKVCVTSVSLWRCLMMLEERVKGVLRARPTGEMARMKLPKNDAVWLECIRLERRSKNDKLADNLMSKALQECPTSDILLAEDLLTCIKTSQRSKCIEAMKKCPNNAIVFTTVARLLEKNHRVLKARKYYVRALNIDNKYGDAYVYYYICEYLRLHKKRLLQEGIIGNHSSGSNSHSLGNGGGNSNETERGDGAGTEELDGIDEDDDDEDELEVAEDPAAAESTMIAVSSGGDIVGPSPAELQVLASIVQQCTASNPNRGELWCSFTKSDVKLRRAEAAVKLRAVVEHVLGFKVNS